ncbi:CopG family transcriptional regulator, partial [Salmonella enterica]|nr:CopG family transcriptional regulator [Salmonella enterica]EBQ6901324.1 CopG family transcriptional regulator [Salmonella enterica]
MALKLNRPNIDESQQPATNAETARFISGATRAPVVGKPKLMNFRLSAHF